MAQGSGTVTLSGAITGANGISASGTGTVTLSGLSGSYAGDLNASVGQLNLTDASSLGGNSGTFIFSGARLDSLSAGITLASTKAKNWNSDFTYLASRNITFGSGAVTLSGNRILTINSSQGGNTFTENGAIGDGGNGYSLTKAGLGTLSLNGANTYGGATNVTAGTLNMTGAGSSAANSVALTISGGVMNLGAASGTGVANRFNANAPLALGGTTGGGTLILNAGATAPLNSQAFTTLTVGVGSNVLGSSNTTNPGTFSFTDAAASVYTRAVGGTIRLQGLAGSAALFANVPTGSGVIGSGTSAILVGAVSGTGANIATDFVRPLAAAPTAPVYATNTWSSGANTNVTGSFSLAANSTTQSLRFNDPIARTLTLSGTNTVESGGILVTSNATGATATGAPQTITGGTIQAAAGKDLWIYTVGASTQDFAIGSVIGDNAGSSLTKSGARTLYLTNAANTYTGGTYLNEGVLNVVSGGSLGDVGGPLRFGGSATLQAGAASVDLAARAISVPTGSSATFDSNGNAITSSGVISGGGSLIKTGAGTVTLSGANTASGGTTVLRGTLSLDFNGAGAPVADIGSTGALILGQYINASVAGNETVEIKGKAGAASAQTFSSVTLGRGASHLNLTAGAGGTLSVNLGNIYRNSLFGVVDSAANQGVALDIGIGAGVTVATNNVNSNGILTPFGLSSQLATVNGNTWATVSAGTIIGLPTASYSTSYSTPNVNVDVSGSNTLTNSPFTLRFNSTAPTALTLGAGAVRQIAGGGILVTSNVGANLTTIGGAPLAGIGRRDLIIYQNNTAGDLQIDAPIVDFQAGNQPTTKAGAGKLILNGLNTNTGAAFIHEGTVVVTTDPVAAPTGITASSTSGSTTITVSDASNLFIGQAVSNSTFLPPANAGANLTYSIVAISGNVVTLSNPSVGTAPAGTAFTFSGSAGLGLGAGTSNGTHAIAPGATLQLGNGGATGSILAGQSIINNGSLIINRSSDLAFSNVVSGAGMLEKQGGGNLTISGVQTYIGDTKVTSGTVTLGTSTVLQNSTVDLSGGSLAFGALTSATLGGLKGTQDLLLTNANNAAVGLSLGLGTQPAFSSGVTYAGSLSGLGGLSKNGNGTFTLAGANSYAGTTVVNAGALAITGTSSGGGALTIGMGTALASLTLSGTGSFSGAPGASVTVSNIAGNVAILNVGTGTSLSLTANGTTLGNNGDLLIGAASSSTGVVNQTGGAVTVNGQFVVGSSTAGYGFYNQTGGSFTHGGGAGANGTRFRIGVGASSDVGLYYLSGGTASYTGGNNTIGISETGSAAAGNVNSVGVMYISGTGKMIGGPTTQVAIAYNGTASTGTGNTMTGQLTIGGNGSTAAALSALSVTTANPQTGQLGASTINLLSGGTLTTGNITKNANGTSNLNFNGGTLKVGTTNTSVANSLTGVYSYAAGAAIDTNSLNYTLAAPLLAPTGAGVSSIAISDGGAGYVGAPAVLLSGGSGSGATAVAQVADGKVTGILVTNPGTGYGPGDLLTATLVGGGAGTTAILGTPILAANESGGLTKSGAGTLTTSSMLNSYTGPTVVNGGTMNVSGSINSSSNVSVTGVTLLLSGSGDKLRDTGAVALAAGTLKFADSGPGAFNEVAGTFGLSGSAVVDFGSSTTAGNTFTFSGLAASTVTGLNSGQFTLDVWNWSLGAGGAIDDGTTNGTLGDAQDRLLLSAGSGLNATGLAQVKFYSGSSGAGLLGSAQQVSYGSQFELVPVPEPSAIALLGGAGMFSLLTFRKRRRGERK